MGLDLFDLVLAIEKEFDVELTEADSQSIVTVGDLYDFVLDRTETKSPDNFLSKLVLSELRAGLKACGMTETIDSATPIYAILPNSDRRRFWNRLSKSMDRRLPKLVRPMWVTWINILATISLSIMVFVIASRFKVTGVNAPIMGLLGLVVFGFLAGVVSIGLATEPDEDIGSLADLSDRIVGLNYTELKRRYGSFGKRDVRIVLHQILVDCLGVDHDEITADAQLVRDLGCE